MKYQLIEYQETAAREVLERLAEAVEMYRGRFTRRSSFALSAVTGAGKTVIAAAVIEALFHGSSQFGVESDPNAVVLWLTDDESLNNQTRQRMIQSSELSNAQLVSINSPHFPEVLSPHTVYFLNVQKLYDNSVNYTKPTKERPYSLWETLRNTITDESRTFYLVLDEAHKGMGNGKQSRSTTVQRVINGLEDVPPVPIVWGISATTERFKQAMDNAKDRSALPDWEVPVSEVQASGLLKDSILLRPPDESGLFDTVLLRYAVEKTVEQSALWATYCDHQKLARVLPLLVLQLGNEPAQAELDRLVSTIQDEWLSRSGEALPDDAVSHVFGDHKEFVAGGRSVTYIEPENVQDDTRVRVLLAKNAVTTGWDCPRAEVLISMRGSTDRTVITQFIGRMVRTPLARSVPGNDPLNSVVCLLPHFDKKTTQAVASLLTDGNYDGNDKASGGSGLRVLSGRPVTLSRNAEVPDEIFKMFASLPSESKPNPKAKPIPRLFSLATALAGDSLLPGAIEHASRHLYSVLDGLMAQHAAVASAHAKDIEEAQVATLLVSLKEGTVTEQDKVALAADSRLIDDAYRQATRTFTKQVANGYQKHRAEADADGDEPDLMQAKLEVAALAAIPEVAEALSQTAATLTQTWFDQFDVAIANLTDARKSVYDRIKDKSPTPMLRPVELPVSKIEEAAPAEGDPYDTRPKHLLSDDTGLVPIPKLNGWERTVVDTELNRPGVDVLGWYRNPSQATAAAIRVPYQKVDGGWSSFQPDFVFFTKRHDGTTTASLIEPHRDHGDTLQKLLGLADFVEKYPNAYLRVEFMEEDDRGRMKKLDLNDKQVRAAIRKAAHAKELFTGPHAQVYA